MRRGEMYMKKNKLIYIFASLFMLLILSACGNSDDSKSSGDEPIRIAVTEGSPPFSFVDSEGKLVGFDVDYSEEIGKRIGKEIEIISTAWEGILPGLLADKYDLIIGSMAITEERQKSVNFSTPYYTSGAAIVIHNDTTDINTPSDLKGRSVGATLGTTYEEEVRKIGGNVKTYNTEVDQLTDLENKRIEAMVTDKFIGAFTIKELKRPLKVLDEMLYDEEIGIAVRKEDKELLDLVNKAIEEINTDGTYEELALKHFGIK